MIQSQSMQIRKFSWGSMPPDPPIVGRVLHVCLPPPQLFTFCTATVGVFLKNIMTLENMPIPLFEEPLNPSPIDVFSSDYGSHSIAQ